MRCWIVVALLVAYPAAADVRREDVEQAATALFEQGRALLEAGQEPAACVKFEASLRLDPQIGTKLNVAACRENQGRLVEAYRLFEECARADAEIPAKQQREVFARERMQKLLARLVRVKLAVSENAQVVQLEGVERRELPREEWTREHVVLPGTLVVTVRAPGYQPLRIEHVNLAGALATYDALALAPVSAGAPREPERPEPGQSRSNLPWLVGGAGVVALGVSAGLGLHAKSRHTDATAAFDAGGVASAQREADIATGVAIAGIAAVTVGAVLYVRGRRTAIVPTTTAGGAGIGVTGSF